MSWQAKGKVVDSVTGKPVPGVSVVPLYSTKNSNTGTVGDNAGIFKLVVSDIPDWIRFHSVGYEISDVPAGAFINSEPTITLQPGQAETLTEVVVTPGNNKKSGNTWLYIVLLTVAGAFIVNAQKKK